MGSPCSEEWLELSLGLFKGTKKKLQQKEEKEEDESKMVMMSSQKKVICATTSLDHDHQYQHLLEKEYDNNGEDSNLELKLQIGPSNKTYNMDVMDLMYHHQKWSLFHRDYYNYSNSSITNFGLISSSSSSSPNSAGLWFSLLSSPNRKGGGALPQIAKPYIRVKDEKMTVLMVKKYLLTKLGLSNQPQVELWCMGERLLETQSLKQVRDGIWVPKLVEFVNSNSSLNLNQNQNHPSSTTNYLMSLHYGTTCFF